MQVVILRDFEGAVPCGMNSGVSDGKALVVAAILPVLPSEARREPALSEHFPQFRSGKNQRGVASLHTFVGHAWGRLAGAGTKVGAGCGAPREEHAKGACDCCS